MLRYRVRSPVTHNKTTSKSANATRPMPPTSATAPKSGSHAAILFSTASRKRSRAEALLKSLRSLTTCAAPGSPQIRGVANDFRRECTVDAALTLRVACLKPCFVVPAAVATAGGGAHAVFDGDATAGAGESGAT